jgi:dUTP pyrophosphatase
MTTISFCKTRNHQWALPKYQTALAAGLDLVADIDSEITLKPLERQLVNTGFSVEIPAGFEGQVRPRSGLSLKKGLTVLNSPGTIDADYRGEIKVILVNLSNEVATVAPGERVAQLVISPVEQAEIVEVTHMSETKRGSAGFGSTGT